MYIDCAITIILSQCIFCKKNGTVSQTGIIVRRNQYIEEGHRKIARPRGPRNLWQWSVEVE